MTHTTLRRASLAATFSLLAAAPTAAQDGPIRFTPKVPMMRYSVFDAPALLAALPDTDLGKLLAEPEVAAAIERGRENYSAKVTRWAQVVDRLAELDPSKLTMDTLLQRQVFDLDWRDLRTTELIAITIPDRFGIQTMLSVEPVPAAEGRLAQRFESLASRLRTLAADPGSTSNLQVAGDKIDGYPALVLAARETQDDADDFSRFGVPPGAWLLHLPGQFAGGDGSVELAGACHPTATAAAAIDMELRVPLYLALFGQMGAGNQVTANVVRLLGLDVVEAFRWQLRPAGQLLQDEISLDVTGPPGGVLGALLDSATPLLDQPLPEHGMLQLRFGFDVPALLEAIDGLLQQADAPTLASVGLVEDLQKAWNGSVALAIVRPAPGGLVPRMYASFGIADQAAFGRVIAHLHELDGIEPKAVTYEGKPCMQLRIDGAPPALQPSYCLQDGVVHFAESGISLRAMLKAAANGAPTALDTGEAELPAGPGAAIPSFDLRFDGAAIYAALHELWLPIAGTLLPFGGGMRADGARDMGSLVPMADMPDLEVVTSHLRPGRGVLRRAPGRVVLSMTGTAGGPELHAMLAAYGPLLSGPMTSSWQGQTESAQQDLTALQLERIGQALARFQTRTGKLPASFGELLAGGDLTDASLLCIAGDDQSQPVMHDGKEVARTSFEYHADGKKMSPDGNEVVARVTTLHAFGWRGHLLTDDGVVHDYWGDSPFAEQVLVQPVETIEVETEAEGEGDK